jgi:DNA-binding response OmpR family regulator
MNHLSELSEQKPMRVLLVDDDREFSSLLASSLEKEHGARVHCVSSAYDAMNELLDSSYGLVVLDWDLAGMSGFQALKEVDNAMDLDDRMPLGKSRTPVVVLSAHDPSTLPVSSREKKHFSIRRVLSKRHDIRQLVDMLSTDKVRTAV